MKSIFITLAISLISLTASAEQVLICVASDTGAEANMSIEQATGVYLYVVNDANQQFIEIANVGVPLKLQKESASDSVVTYQVSDSNLKAVVTYVSGINSSETKVTSVVVGENLVATNLVKDEEESKAVSDRAGDGYSCSRGDAEIK